MNVLARRLRSPGTAWISAGLACTAALAGCWMFKPVQFTNVSDTWLSVRFYAGDPQRGDGPNRLVSRRAYEIAPGRTVRFTPSGRLVHLRVTPVTPSWAPDGDGYWLEITTRPPVHIVATGREDRLDFKAGSGELAVIPNHELTGGRYDYQIAGADDRGSPRSGGPD